MKRNDFILVGGLLTIAIVLLVFITLTKENGSYVIVMVAGEETERLPLNQVKEVLIEGYHNGTNRLIIKDGYAYMEDASCPDQYLRSA